MVQFLYIKKFPKKLYVVTYTWPKLFSSIKFVFSKKATKLHEIFTVDLTLTTYCQIDGEDFCGLLRKHEL